MSEKVSAIRSPSRLLQGSRWFVACYVLLILIAIGGLATSQIFSHNLLQKIDNFVEADDALNYKLKRLFHMSRLIRSSAFHILNSDTSDDESVEINLQMFKEISLQLVAALDQDGLPRAHSIRDAVETANKTMELMHSKVKLALASAGAGNTIDKDTIKHVYDNLGVAMSRVQNLQEQILAYQESYLRDRAAEAIELRSLEVYCGLFLFVVALIIASVGGLLLGWEKKQNQLITTQQAVLVTTSKMSSLGEMAGSIAHEIKTPLAVIHGRARHIRLLLGRAELDRSKLNEFAETIERTAQKITHIVQGMKALSRNAEQDPLMVARINDIMEETLSLCTDKFTSHQVALSFLPPPLPLEVSCRPSQLAQVLLNLMNNSYDAILELETKWIRVSMEEAGEMLEIRVMDSGSGVPAAVRERIFTPFFTTKEVGKGTGLGLSISKAIIEEHGGRLFIDENVAHTCFVICLPLHRAPAAMSA